MWNRCLLQAAIEFRLCTFSIWIVHEKPILSSFLPTTPHGTYHSQWLWNFISHVLGCSTCDSFEIRAPSFPVYISTESGALETQLLNIPTKCVCKCIDFQGQSRWKSTNLHHLKIQDYTSDKMERTRTLSGTMCLCLRCGLGQNFMRKTREQMHFAASSQGQCESEKSSTQFHTLRRCLCWQTDDSTENRCDALAPHCHWQLSIFFSASMYGSKAEVAMQKINKTRVSSAKCNLCWIWVLDILKHFAGYFWVVVATNFAPESCIVCAMNVFSEAEFLCLNNNCSMSTPHRDRTIKYIFWYRFWLQRRRFWQTAQW